MADVGDKITTHLAGVLAICNVVKTDQHRTAIDRSNAGHIAQCDLKGGVLRAVIGQMPRRARFAIQQTGLDCGGHIGLPQDGGKMAPDHLRAK